MPKLTTYLDQQQGAPAGDVQPGREGGASLREQDPAIPQLSPKYAAAAAKLRGDYEKRLASYGPRTYRWPDGTLRPEKPPPNPHAAANRQRWEQLVLHCRTHGGDRGFERNGYSLRYGIGVPRSDHVAYLQQIGLEPDADAQGRQRGWEPSGPQSPLEDPDHCFNTFYKAGAEAVFKNRRGRLL